MRHLALALLGPAALAGSLQAQNPMAIPPALELDTFDLVVDEHVHQFYPGVNTNTYGASAEYLGPTLILNQGDTAHIRIHNQLAQITNMHWHGLRVPGEFDGGPPREIEPGGSWKVEYEVKNPAGTYWYHPHPHELTAEQANMGVAGFIIVRDDEEAALDLPRTYGVDDFPVVIQDRKFNLDGSFAFGPYGDSVLVNGTPRAYLECPAQVVRLRLLNGSNARVYPIGFENGQDFTVIAGDGGLLNAPVSTDRLRLSNGERAEILLDLTGLEGDSLLIMSFGSELPQTVPGANNILWESSSLNGIDFPVLRIRVTAPTATPVTTIPSALVNVIPLNEADATNTRTKTFSGMGMVGMGMFYINGDMFDIDVINDTIQLNAVEIWEVENLSNMAHPFHIHGGSFYILDRDGAAPPAWEQGAKDVVLVDAGEVVRLIMRFEELSGGWPFMYHCHNLMHEDNMMMAQYIVVDPNVIVSERTGASGLRVFPSPTPGTLTYQAPFAVEEILLTDGLGRTVLKERGSYRALGTIDLSNLPSGPYLLLLRSGDEWMQHLIVRE